MKTADPISNIIKMKHSFFKYTFLIAITLGICLSCKEQEATPGKGSGSTEVAHLQVDLSDTGIKVQPTMYGIFFEDINFAADGGLYAEMIKNRSFEFLLPKIGWSEPNSNKHSHNNESGILNPIQYTGENSNHRYARVEVKGPNYELINEGFRGMGVKKDGKYNLTLDAKKVSGDIKKIQVQLIDTLQNVLGEAFIIPDGETWKNYKAQLTASKTEGKAQLKLTFEGAGVIDLDMISMFPEDTWKGRERGLRKDLVQLLADLNLGFLRFPGGCIVEGRTLERRYQWKKTVGGIEDREVLVNRWNTEFMHKFTPDYYQSFGLGFFEYFQLSEDLGAEPLPILSCGIACQFNTGELVPMEELDPYVQDALDMIEFANGSVSTEWGKLRAEMGHPEPFNLKYIGIGNEQWGEVYIERYKVFHKAIKEVYPEIVIVSGSGPFPDGDYFEYGWEQLKAMNAEIVDEHYYRSPEWFLENADRYDGYDRKGPKVFAGEYAAHPKDVEDGPKENNWEGALAEAAFMTGLERNADVVTMTSYAPLMAHIDAFQWAPDMIWFNNLESYGTPNYYVQKLFANNPGTDVVHITKNGEVLAGEGDLYASAVKDSNAGELIIKIINTSKWSQKIQIGIQNGAIHDTAEHVVLKSEELSDSNTFETPEKISPKSIEINVNDEQIELELQSNSVNMLKVKIKSV